MARAWGEAELKEGGMAGSPEQPGVCNRRA